MAKNRPCPEGKVFIIDDCYDINSDMYKMAVEYNDLSNKLIGSVYTKEGKDQAYKDFWRKWTAQNFSVADKLRQYEMTAVKGAALLNNLKQTQPVKVDPKQEAERQQMYQRQGDIRTNHNLKDQSQIIAQTQNKNTNQTANTKPTVIQQARPKTEYSEKRRYENNKAYALRNNLWFNTTTGDISSNEQTGSSWTKPGSTPFEQTMGTFSGVKDPTSTRVMGSIAGESFVDPGLWLSALTMPMTTAINLPRVINSVSTALRTSIPGTTRLIQGANALRVPTSTALRFNLPTSGITYGDAINLGFGLNSAYNLSNPNSLTRTSLTEAYNNPTVSNILGTTGNVALDGLGIFGSPGVIPAIGAGVNFTRNASRYLTRPFKINTSLFSTPIQTGSRQATVQIFNKKTGMYETRVVDIPNEIIPGRSFADVQHKMKNLRNDLNIGSIENFFNKRGFRKYGIPLERDKGLIINSDGRIWDSNTRYWLNRMYGKTPDPLELIEPNIYQYARSFGKVVSESPTATMPQGRLVFNNSSRLGIASSTNNPFAQSTVFSEQQLNEINQSGAEFDKYITNRVAQMRTPEGRRRIQQYIDDNPSIVLNKTVDDIINETENITNFSKTYYDDVNIHLPNVINRQAKLRDDYNLSKISNDDYLRDMQSLTDEEHMIRESMEKFERDFASSGYYTGSEHGAFISPVHLKTGDFSTVAEHEVMAHGFQHGTARTALDNELQNLKLLDEPYQMPSSTIDESIPVNQRSPLLNVITSGGESYFPKVKNYFQSGSNYLEKLPHALEIRQQLFKQGKIKGLYDPISEDMLVEHYTNYMNMPQGAKYPIRIYDIMQNNPFNFQLLSKVLNKAPGIVPTAIGVGTGTYLLNNSNSNTSSQQRKGGLIKANLGLNFSTTFTTTLPLSESDAQIFSQTKDEISNWYKGRANNPDTRISGEAKQVLEKLNVLPDISTSNVNYVPFTKLYRTGAAAMFFPSSRNITLTNPYTSFDQQLQETKPGYFGLLNRNNLEYVNKNTPFSKNYKEDLTHFYNQSRLSYPRKHEAQHYWTEDAIDIVDKYKKDIANKYISLPKYVDMVYDRDAPKDLSGGDQMNYKSFIANAYRNTTGLQSYSGDRGVNRSAISNMRNEEMYRTLMDVRTTFGLDPSRNSTSDEFREIYQKVNDLYNKSKESGNEGERIRYRHMIDLFDSYGDDFEKINEINNLLVRRNPTTTRFAKLGGNISTSPISSSVTITTTLGMWDAFTSTVSDWVGSLFDDKEEAPQTKTTTTSSKTGTNTTPNEIKLIDGRKIRATTKQKINPNVDLKTGTYNLDILDNVLRYAKQKGLSIDDAYNLSAMALAETGFGKTDANIGHVLDKEGPYDRAFVDMYIEKMKYADRLGIKDPFKRLQVYNGLGWVYPKTEEGYHGFQMKKIYGVPIGKGINLRNNPLYGIEVSDLRDNILKANKSFVDHINLIYKKYGGSIKNLHRPIKSSIFATGGLTFKQAYDFLFDGEDNARSVAVNSAPSESEVDDLRAQNESLLRTNRRLNREMSLSRNRNLAFNVVNTQSYNKPSGNTEEGTGNPTNGTGLLGTTPNTKYGSTWSMQGNVPEFTTGSDGRLTVLDKNEKKNNNPTTTAAGEFGAFFAPDVKYRISSEFGKRKAPKKGASTYHRAIDIATDPNTPIFSPSGGVVTRVSTDSGLGNRVEVELDNGTTIRLGHLNYQDVKVGQRVERGHQLGRVGSTGISTGPHLHLEVLEGDNNVNPRKYFKF